MEAKPKPSRRLRELQAQLRYGWILAHEFRATLALFAGLLLFGGLLFFLFDRDPVTGAGPDFFKSLYFNFTVMITEYAESFPDHVVLRIWYFAGPILCGLLVSEALVRFGVLLISKANSSERWVKAMVATYNNHVILCGLGHLGVRVMRELVQQGEDVVVIELNPQAFGVDEARRLNVPVMHADARNEQVLRELGVEQAKCVIAGTDNDMANLEIAMDARQLQPGIRIVMRMFDDKLGKKLAKELDIKLIFSTTALAAPSFVAAVGNRAVVNSFHIDDKTVETAKFPIGAHSPLVGKSIQWFYDQYPLAIISHRRSEAAATLFPNRDTTVQAGDRLIVEAEHDIILALQKINGSE